MLETARAVRRKTILKTIQIQIANEAGGAAEVVEAAGAKSALIVRMISGLAAIMARKMLRQTARSLRSKIHLTIK